MINSAPVNGKPKKKVLSASEQQKARDVLVATGHSHRSAAEEISMHPSLLSQIINGKRPCTDEIAARIYGICPRTNIPKKSYIRRAKIMAERTKKGTTK